MIKINNLYKYLIKNNYLLEANYLYKLAARIDEEKYKNDYPVIYEAWEDRNNNNIPDKPWRAYANMLKNAEEKNILIDKNKVYIFEELKELLTKEKQTLKTQKQDDLVEFLNQNLPSNKVPSEKDLNLARENGLNKEEILYLINDTQNHTWFEKVDMASNFNKARGNAFSEQDRNKTIMDFSNIDDVIDFLYSHLNKAPQDLEVFYQNLKPQALATSVTVYNSENYLVKHSKSMKAAQYWEQSCVTVDKDGKVSSGTCTAQTDEDLNYFDYYDKEAEDPIYSFQIITKEYETLKETPRTSFKDKNKFYNLISLSISKNSGEVKWGGSDTVNRQNTPVQKGDFFHILKDEYDLICDSIIKYCNSNFKLQVENLKTSEAEEITEASIEFMLDFKGATEFTSYIKENISLDIQKDVRNKLGVLLDEEKLKEIDQFIIDEKIEETISENIEENNLGFNTSDPFSVFYKKRIEKISLSILDKILKSSKFSDDLNKSLEEKILKNLDEKVNEILSRNVDEATLNQIKEGILKTRYYKSEMNNENLAHYHLQWRIHSENFNLEEYATFLSEKFILKGLAEKEVINALYDSLSKSINSLEEKEFKNRKFTKNKDNIITFLKILNKHQDYKQKIYNSDILEIDFKNYIDNFYNSESIKEEIQKGFGLNFLYIHSDIIRNLNFNFKELFTSVIKAYEKLNNDKSYKITELFSRLSYHQFKFKNAILDSIKKIIDEDDDDFEKYETKDVSISLIKAMDGLFLYDPDFLFLVSMKTLFFDLIKVFLEKTEQYTVDLSPEKVSGNYIIDLLQHLELDSDLYKNAKKIITSNLMKRHEYEYRLEPFKIFDIDKEVLDNDPQFADQLLKIYKKEIKAISDSNGSSKIEYLPEEVHQSILKKDIYEYIIENSDFNQNIHQYLDDTIDLEPSFFIHHKNLFVDILLKKEGPLQDFIEDYLKIEHYYDDPDKSREVLKYFVSQEANKIYASFDAILRKRNYEKAKEAIEIIKKLNSKLPSYLLEKLESHIRENKTD